MLRAGADEVLWGCRRVSYTDLTGSIPTEVGRLLQMTGLECTNGAPTQKGGLTKMTGSIPTELGLLTMLEQLDMWRNEFTGPLPTELGLIPTFQYL